MSDIEKLQGQWLLDSMSMDGYTTAAGNGASIEITGDKFVSRMMGATYKGSVLLGQSKKPKTIDLLFTDGPEAGNRNFGIYKIGKNSWTLCLATHGDKRPAEFATSAGGGIALEVFRRPAHEESANGPADASRGRDTSGTTEPGIFPVTGLEGEWAMVSGIFNGAAMDQSMVKWCRRITRGNITTVMGGPQVMFKMRFSVDFSNSPHKIDYENLEGSAAGESQLGILELDGSTLKVCVAAVGQLRPREFSSHAGDGKTFTTWRRLNK